MIPLINDRGLELEDLPDYLEDEIYHVMILNGYVFRFKQTYKWDKDSTLGNCINNWAKLKHHKYIVHNAGTNYKILYSYETNEEAIDAAYHYIAVNNIKKNIYEMLEDRASKPVIHPVYFTKSGYHILPSRRQFAKSFNTKVSEVVKHEQASKEMLIYKDGWIRTNREGIPI